MAERQGDIEEVNFRAGTVDCVMCCSGFAYLNDTVVALRRYRSWLRPGGRCIHRLFIGYMRGPYLQQCHAYAMLVWRIVADFSDTSLDCPIATMFAHR